MPSIPAILREIYNSQLKFIYLKNPKLFLDILFHFWDLNKILNLLKRDLSLIA